MRGYISRRRSGSATLRSFEITNGAVCADLDISSQIVSNAAAAAAAPAAVAAALIATDASSLLTPASPSHPTSYMWMAILKTSRGTAGDFSQSLLSHRQNCIFHRLIKTNQSGNHEAMKMNGLLEEAAQRVKESDHSPWLWLHRDRPSTLVRIWGPAHLSIYFINFITQFYSFYTTTQ